MDFEPILKQVQDTLVVMAAIQERQAKVQRLQAEELDAMREHMQMLRAGQKLHEQANRKFDEKMAEIEDKLNGLIGYMDDSRRPPE